MDSFKSIIRIILYGEIFIMNYELLLRQAAALVKGERHPLPNMANLSALLWENLCHINWAGFYVVVEDGLLLGPFQGKPACIRIPWGKGVCGAAAAKAQPIVVPDVQAFPGHIACDSTSRSEIVIPVLYQNRVAAVLDIDSPILERFTQEDAAGLTRLAELAAAACDWPLILS